MRAPRTRSWLLGTVTLSLVLSACSGGTTDQPGPGEESDEMPQSVVGPDFSTVFDADSLWYDRIDDDAAIDPRSDEYVAALVEEGENPVVSVNGWTMPVYEADAATPRYTIQPTEDYVAGGWTLRDVPIPDAAAPDPQEDGHMVVVDRDEGCVYEFWQARREGTGWTASWANATPTDGDGVYPDGLSSRASGLSAIAGLIWPQELAEGRIDHALVFAYPNTRSGGPVPPATASDGTTDDDTALPEGARLRLDPSIDVDSLGLSPTQNVIAEALQTYGMILADTSGGMSLYAASPQSFENFPYPTSWSGDIWKDLSAIPFESMQVLEVEPQVERYSGPPVTNRCSDGAFGGAAAGGQDDGE
ncbi:hypothetical protein GCM10010210_44160 [Pseudonocardia hydrocarbonoxydans]|uniref:Lipoprotein n=1 Tax=Pseudonocardia hydrocarbonoxydans TaxID=76726 RepID=A0A4Y3WJL3_9PSEU|nr:hypothetical protein PHY01_14250 [Pseudonocardia hydrocarbonoxydans]